MVEQVGIDQGVIYRINKPVLKIAVLLSALAHLVVIAVWQFPSTSVQDVAEHTFRVELIPRPALVETVDEIIFETSVETPVETPVKTPHKKSVEPASIDDQQPNQPISPARPDTSEIHQKRLITTIAPSVEDPIWQPPSIDCDLAQRASEVFDCSDDVQRDWEALSTRQHHQFAYDDATSQFQRDMAITKRLMRRQESLDQMIELVGYVPDDLGAERREVRRMLDGIEDKYATMDLLRIIGAGSKKIADVWGKVKPRK